MSTCRLRKKKEIGTEKICILEDIMIENFSKLMNDINPQFQEAQQIPNSINIKKTISCHIIVD